MTVFATLKTSTNLLDTVSGFLKTILSEHLVDGVLVAAPTPYSPLPMPTLFTDPEKIAAAEPLAPVAPFNTARQAASVLRHESGKRLALVMRPCEIRALVELAKLQQCTLDNVLIFGIECLGRMENKSFLEAISADPDAPDQFYQDQFLREFICPSCRICIKFEPENADISLCVLGLTDQNEIGLLSNTDAGTQILKHLGMEIGQEPNHRRDRITQLMDERKSARERLLAATKENTDSIEKLETFFANCLNCYNCRVACPVCYCKECVFLTDVFAHDPEVIFRRASKKGVIKLPQDTTMFHLTRMAHMAHACVGCGHCSSVCPSDIAVADIFIRVAQEIQDLYDYEPGRDINEPIPLLVVDEVNTCLPRKAEPHRS